MKLTHLLIILVLVSGLVFAQNESEVVYEPIYGTPSISMCFPLVGILALIGLVVWIIYLIYRKTKQEEEKKS